MSLAQKQKIKQLKTSIHPLTALSKTLKIQEGLFELVRVF